MRLLFYRNTSLIIINNIMYNRNNMYIKKMNIRLSVRLVVLFIIGLNVTDDNNVYISRKLLVFCLNNCTNIFIIILMWVS